MLNYFYRNTCVVVVLLYFDVLKIAASGPLKIPSLGLIPNGGSSRQQRAVIIVKEDDWIDSCEEISLKSLLMLS